MKYWKLCLILLLTSVLLSGCHTAPLPQEDASQAAAPEAIDTSREADASQAAETSAALEAPGEISEETIAWLNSEYFNLDGSVWMRNMMLTSVYEDVREIDLYSLFYNGIPEVQNDISEEEKTLLSAIDANAAYLDITKVTTAQMDAVLQTYAGIGLDQTERRGLDQLIYLEQYDAYYLIHGDCIDARCEVLSGTRTEDGYLILQYRLPYWMDSGYEVTLREAENGLLFVSNMSSDSSTPAQVMGEAYAEAVGKTDDPIVAAFKGQEIRQSAVDYEKQNLIVMQGKTAATDEDALNSLLQNLTMLEEAERLDLSVTQEEVEYELSGQRENYEAYEGVREIVDDFCENAGISIEQHYAIIEEQMPRVILRQKLRDTLGQEYCAQHGLEFTKVNPPQEMLDYVDNYLNGLLDTYRADITYYQDLETQ